MTDPTYTSVPAPQPIEISDMAPDEQRTWGAFVHAIGFFWGFAGAWFAYLVLRNRGGLVRSHAAAELNIALTYTIGVLVAFPLMLVPILNILVGLVLVSATVARVVFVVVAATRAHHGHLYKIPGAIRFVS